MFTTANHTLRNHFEISLIYKGNATKHLSGNHDNVARTLQKTQSDPPLQVAQSSVVSLLKHGLTPISNIAQMITRAMGRFLVSKLRRFALVESKSFRQLMQVIEPLDWGPNRHHFSEILLPNTFEEAKLKVQTKVSQAKRMSLSTGGMTSRAGQSYVTIAIHFIDLKWEMKSFALQTGVLEDSHLAAVLKEV